MAQCFNVAIIGAGTAGLVAARELRREGHQVTVFERNSRVGGLWVYDPRTETDPMGLDPTREIVSGSLYSSLRVNFPRQLMSYLDYPFLEREGGDSRTFPGHEEVLRYLEDFTRDFGLVDLIRFGHEVIRVERVDEASQKWVVEWKNQLTESGGKSTSEELFDAVVICNGKHTQPKIAEFPGRDAWPGLQIHSHNYRTPEPFLDKIVVVIGKASSARDILKEILPIAREVHQAIRGLEKLEKLNSIWQHPMIESANEDGKVVFKDGSVVYADVIIHCTGYKYHFPFLRTNGIVNVDDHRVGPLYKHVFPPRFAPRLSFLGLPCFAVPSLVTELQGRWVAKVLSGKAELPSEEEMADSVEQLYKHMEETGWPKHDTHKLQQDKFEYESWLVAQTGSPPFEIWREKLFFFMKKISLHYGGEFRDTFDVEKWIQEIDSSN